MRDEEKEGFSDSGELFFRVDAGLLLQLGEQLVVKQSVALAELVKNAYDADATEVVIRLENVKQPGGTIIIKDDGTGMTFREIQRAWMTVATPEKLYDPLSTKYRRRRTGAKGVGRFAARKLARRLSLRTVAEIPESGIRESVQVDFDWDRFKDGESVDKVGSTFRRQEVGPDEPLGTSLVLEAVREGWSPKEFQDLHRQLRDVTSPYASRPSRQEELEGSSQDPGFSMKIESPDYPEYTGFLEDRFLSAAYATLLGYLKESGEPEYELTFRGEEEELKFIPSEIRLPAVGPCVFEIKLFMYSRDYFKGLEIGIGQARQVARSRAGVRVFLEGFRVAGYGEVGDDWLSLDNERAGRLQAIPSYLQDLAEGVDRPMLLLPGNNQLFGAVYLSREDNPNLEITLSRERLVENEAFLQLKAFLRAGINWMTVVHARRLAKAESGNTGTNRSQAVVRDEIGLARKTLQISSEKLANRRAQLLSEKTVDAATFVKIGGDIESDFKAVEEHLATAQEAWKSEERKRIAESSMLKVLASTGTMIALFDHHLAAVLSGLRDAYHGLVSAKQRLSETEKDAFDEQLRRLDGWIRDIEGQVRLFGALLGRTSRTNRQRIGIRPIAESVKSAFEVYMTERGIDFVNEIPADLRTPPVFECEITAILLNLMTNALKALRDQPIKSIRVSGKRDVNSVIISFSDTGRGAPKDKWTSYFEPFESDSEPDPVLGHGTGLGLKIVRDLLDSYGGEASFVEPSEPWRTRIEIVLPEE